MNQRILTGSVTVMLRLSLLGLAIAIAVPPAAAQELLNAAEKGDFTKVKTLIEVEGIDVNLKGGNSQTALIWAASNGHLDIAKYLVEKGAEVNHRETGFGKSALMIAAEAGYAETVAYLINLA